MAKEPVAGRAKTRLGADLGHGVAAEFARAFLLDTLETVGELLEKDVSVEVHFDGPAARRWFEECVPEGVRVFEQVSGDLGERMSAAFRSVFARGGEACLLIGTDTPAVLSATLEHALGEIGPGRVVLGPSEDGGYWAIGLSEAEERLFEDIDWSTERVFAQSEERKSNML